MSTTLPPHDALKTLRDLREHMARHDKPLGFLFGAGTSCAVSKMVAAGGAPEPLIPAVAGLTEICRTGASGLGPKFATAWAAIVAHCEAAKEATHVEGILSRVRMMLGALGGGDTLTGLARGELVQLEASIRKSIATAVTVNPDDVPLDCPHRRFARWLARMQRQQPVEIFTVNYDVLFEHALESERIPVFDGFVGSFQPFFYPDSLRRSETAPGAHWTRLWKMHGSVTWRRITQDGRLRVVRGGNDPDGAMIYPSFEKYDESRQQPFASLTNRLARFLDQDDAILIVAGFSFGDEHINDLLFEALENRPRTHVFALQFGDPEEQTDLVKRARLRQNMVVVGPESGILGGRRAVWDTSGGPFPTPGIFDVEAPTGAGAPHGAPPPSVGRMKIGGFAQFCSFLETMTA